MNVGAIFGSYTEMQCFVKIGVKANYEQTEYGQNILDFSVFYHCISSGGNISVK